ncbi:MAG TPA: universal stress protein [Burkholderiales bacterium]|nr:universal stress protein [Burkholderiales bacterium]
MFKHILVPTDGSKLAEKGVKAGVKLAKALGAKVSGLYVIMPYIPPMYGEGAIYIPGLSPQEYKRMSEKQAKKVLATVERECKAAGVRCVAQFVTEAQPWKAILKVARLRKCDAISMASHGRGGLGGLLLGSETSHVLTHSKIPVIVIR